MNEKESKLVNEIRTNYVEKEKGQGKLDELLMLDRKVRCPAEIFAYTFGTLGTLVLGTGMCFAMKVLSTATFAMPLGIVIGVLGIAMVSLNYYFYKCILRKQKKKYAIKIVSLSDELLNQ